MFEIEDIHKMEDDEEEHHEVKEDKPKKEPEDGESRNSGEMSRGAASLAPSIDDDKPLGYSVMIKFANTIEIVTSEEGFNSGRSYYVKVRAAFFPASKCTLFRTISFLYMYSGFDEQSRTHSTYRHDGFMNDVEMVPAGPERSRMPALDQGARRTCAVKRDSIPPIRCSEERSTLGTHRRLLRVPNSL